MMVVKNFDCMNPIGYSTYSPVVAQYFKIHYVEYFCYLIAKYVLIYLLQVWNVLFFLERRGFCDNNQNFIN